MDEMADEDVELVISEDVEDLSEAPQVPVLIETNTTEVLDVSSSPVHDQFEEKSEFENAQPAKETSSQESPELQATNEATNDRMIFEEEHAFQHNKKDDKEVLPSSESSPRSYQQRDSPVSEVHSMQSDSDAEGDLAVVEDVSSPLEKEASPNPNMIDNDDASTTEAVQSLSPNLMVTEEDQENNTDTVIIQEPEEMPKSITRKDDDVNSSIRERDEARLAADELNRQLQRRDEELERILAENSTLSAQLTAAINAKCEAMLAAQNVASKEIMLHHKEKCFEQQMEMLHSHNAQLTEQLRKQGMELADLKHISESRILQLERQLAVKTEELRAYEESSVYQSEKLSEADRRVEALLDKIREARDSEINLQEVHAQQLQSQTRLAQLYQEESQEARGLVEKLSTAASEFQLALKEASDRYGELETHSEREKLHLHNKIELRDKKIEALEQELRNANVLLSQSNDDNIERQVIALAPAAAVARKLVKSRLTLTQVYDQYASTIEELESRNAECKHLRDSLNTIIKQLEEKAPQLASDRETLVRVQQENERLLAEHDAAIRQCDEIKGEAQRERQRACRIARDNARLETMINDLSKQVVVLVREVDALKHGCTPSSLNLSSSYESYAGQSASEVLTARLIPFRDVDELQKRNLELLAVVRELTDKAETDEKALSDGQDFVGIMAKLDDAMQQLADLQERKTQNDQLMEQLVQQRDHYREMALHGSTTMARSTQEIALSPMKFDPVTPLKRAQGPSSEEVELREKLKKLEQTLESSMLKYEELKKESATKASRDAAEIQKLKDDLHDSSIVKTKLSAVCEHKVGKLTTVQSKLEELTKKLDTEEKKLKLKSEENEKSHKMLLDMQRELSVHRSMLAESKATIASLDSELKRCRFSELSLRQQCQNLEKSLTDRTSIFASIEEMKSSFERSNAESNTILIKQLDESHLESRGLAKRLEEEGARLSGELAQLQRALDAERAAVLKAQSDTEHAKGEAARVAERLAQAERDVLALRAHRNPNVDTAAQTELCVSEEVLREKRTAQKAVELEQQVTQLRTELLHAEARVSQLSTIVDTSETALQQYKVKAEKNTLEADNRLREAQDAISNLKNRVSELEIELQESRKQIALAETKAAEQVLSLRKELEENQKCAQQICEVEETCQALHSALEAAENEARCVNEALAAEVQKHAEVSKLYSSLEQQLVSEQEDKKKKSNELEQSRQALTAMEIRAAEREAELASASTSWEQKARDLQDQNTTLLDQIQLLGAELCALRQHQQQQLPNITTSSGSNIDLSSSFSSEEPASVEQLLEVLRYLRSERNAAISNAEAVSLQKAELQAQLDTVQKQLQAALSQGSGLEPGASEAVMRARYDELMRRIEVTSVLSESSSRQREAASSLRQENEELKARNVVLCQKQDSITADLRKAREQIETLQIELQAVQGEAGRWRNCANQLTERASRANPEELKRLLQDRENLQRQLGSEREELRKIRINVTERDAELTRLRGELMQVQEHAKKSQEEIASVNSQLKELDLQHKDLVNKEMQVRRIAKKYKTQFEELTKTVEEERTARQEETVAQAQQQALEERVAEVESRLATSLSEAAESKTRISESQAQLTQSESKVQELLQQLESKEQELETLRKDNAASLEKSERAKQVLDSARQRIRQYNIDCTALKEEITGLKQTLHEAQQQNAELQAKLQNAEQTREETAVWKDALTTQYEGKIARLERELIEVQQQQPSRQETQGQKSIASTTEKCSGETPTANIRPMPGPSQAKLQQNQQSATVPPTSRSAPMARLRPMSMGRRSVVVAPSQQQQQQAASTPSSTSNSVALLPRMQVASSAGLSEPSTSRQPAVPVPPMGGTSSKEEVMPTPAPVAEPSTSHESAEPSEEILQSNQQTAGVAVVLVRPQEVQPTVSSSQNIQNATVVPPTSSQPRLAQSAIKRTREESTSTEEPQSKQVRMEVTSATTADAEEEPSSSLHEPPDEIIIVDSEEETEVADFSWSVDMQEEEEEGAKEEDDEEIEGIDYPEDDDDEEENDDGDVEDDEGKVEKIVEGDEFSEDMEDEVEEEEPEDLGDDDDEDIQDAEVETSPAVQEQDEEDDNEVVILEEPPPVPRSFSLVVSSAEPTSSSSVASIPGHASQAHLKVPLQGFEETGDDRIVPSTPTLVSVSAGREGESIGIPQVPQTNENPQFTVTQESGEDSKTTQAAASEVPAESSLESTENLGTGRSVPSTPMQTSPQESVPCVITSVESVAPTEELDVIDAEGEADQPSSTDGVPSILLTVGEEDSQLQTREESAAESVSTDDLGEDQPITSGSTPSRGTTPTRGMNRARRSGSVRSRPSGRPTPIVWDQGQSSAQPPQGMARGMPEGMRVMRGNLFPGRRSRGPRPGFPPYMRHF